MNQMNNDSQALLDPLIQYDSLLGVVVLACNLLTVEAKADGLSYTEGQSQLQSKILSQKHAHSQLPTKSCKNVD